MRIELQVLGGEIAALFAWLISCPWAARFLDNLVGRTAWIDQVYLGEIH